MNEMTYDHENICTLVHPRKTIKWSTPTPRKDSVKTRQIQDKMMERKSLQGQKYPKNYIIHNI